MHNRVWGLRSLLFLHCFFLWAVSVALPVQAQNNAVSQLNLSLSPGKAFTLDLREYWRSTKKVISPADHANSFKPDDVWQWPESQFVRTTVGQTQWTHANERTVSRLRMVVQGEPTELIFRVPAARTDAVHLAYRYDNGPWQSTVAGDKIPMKQWPINNYEPVFTILARAATIDMVVQVVHQGSWNMPFVLQNSERFYSQRMEFSLLMGMLVGVNAVLALVALAAVWTFRRGSFLAVGAMTLAIALQSAFCSGVAGIFLATNSAWLNDEAKFFSNFAWCAILPWVTAVALGERFYARWLWRLAIALAVSGVVGAAVLANYEWRYEMTVWMPFFFGVCSIFSLYMTIDAVWRRQAYARRALLGAALYMAALAVSFSTYFGLMASGSSVVLSSVLTMLAALVFLNVLALQHRQGRMVMSRARSSATRDLLTGVYNAQGFAKNLAHVVNRLESESSYAVLFYVQLGNATAMRERYGDEGFEVSLVQIASSISSVAAVGDTVGRVAQNAFAVCVMMPRNPAMANRYASQLLTRVMSLSNHMAPVAETARVAIAWIPTFGRNLPELQRRCARALDKLASSKRIAWVGGAYAQMDTPPSSIDSTRASQTNTEGGPDNPDIPEADASVELGTSSIATMPKKASLTTF